MNLKHLSLIFLSCVSLAAQAKDVFIIVPGTWSAQSTWYKPSGSFFEALHQSTRTTDAQVITFVWSGENSHKARVIAAEKLAHLITQYEPTDSIHLVTHSHGSNVGILASQLLAQQGFVKIIKRFFALATPVLQEEYAPCMDVIDCFFNFFSLADKVQTVFGIFQRTFLPHDRIANLRVTINGSAPSHSGVHDPLIAYSLPFFHEIVASNGPSFFHNPGILHFSENKKPYYEFDADQEFLVALEHDTFNLDFSFRKIPNESNT